VIPPVLPTYARAPLSFVEGHGAWLIEESGERYLDLGAGIAVTALGHAHPALVKALEDQARRLWHTSNLYRIPEAGALAERLVEHTFADTVFFGNSGTEATNGMSRWSANTRRRARPSATRSSPSRARSTAAHRDDRGHRQREVPRRFRPAAARLRHVPFGNHERAATRRSGRRPRHHGRADPGRGRHAPLPPPLPAGACARSATSTGCC
jgi:acetylornithine/N-succinyldiaminopimelate aminotransferase